MAQKIRSLQAAGGANLNESGWNDVGETAYFASFSSTSTPTYIPISLLPQGTSTFDYLATGVPVYRLQGGQFAVVSQTGMAAQATLNLGLVLIRTFATLSAQIANAGGAITSLPVTALKSPMPSGQAFVITNSTPTLQTWVTSSAVATGATSIPVNSQTPSATYPAGLALSGTVGGGAAATPAILFGWSSGAAGTPAFQPYTSVVLPAISANITAGGGNTVGDAYGPYVPEMPGDVAAMIAYSAGSITVSAGCVSTMSS